MRKKHWYGTVFIAWIIGPVTLQRVTPVPSACVAVRGACVCVHKARGGVGPQADGWGRDRRIQAMLTMFSKRSEPFKGLIATHLWTYLAIFEVRSRERRPRRGWT